MSRKLKFVLAFVAASLAAPIIATPSTAGTLVIGAPGDPNSGNCFPFGCTSWAPEYQQVYASTDFPVAIKIKDLEFYDYNDAPGVVNSGTYTFSLSTTSAAVNGLNLSDLAANIGADNTTVFSGSLPSISGGVLHIELSTPFSYDPLNGNLLIDIYSADASRTSDFLFMDARNLTADGLFSRAMTPGCCGGFADHGLVTGFSTVPEPSTWALILLGFAALGLAGYRASGKNIPIEA
jgi:hypothetical protein